jgi:tetratricopeptide (TPR) repeat protein
MNVRMILKELIIIIKRLLTWPHESITVKRNTLVFWFEHGIKIEQAVELSEEYSSLPEYSSDHWIPFLTAYSYAYKNQIEKGMELFDKWMEKYANRWNIEDSYWPYVFYSKFSLKHNVNIKTALIYAQKAESYSTLFWNKMTLTELLINSGQKDAALDKLKEALESARTSNEYLKAKEMIEKIQ